MSRSSVIFNFFLFSFAFITSASAQELNQFDGNWKLTFCNSTGQCFGGSLKIKGTEGVFIRNAGMGGNNCAGRLQKANISTNDSNDMLVLVEKPAGIQGCEDNNIQFKKITEKQFEAKAKTRSGEGTVRAILD
jgi:hypothetical protein